MKSREQRKEEHINCFMRTFSQSLTNFSDINFVHDSLPEIGETDIDISIRVCNDLVFSKPFIINAITGGTIKSEAINKELAKIAKVNNWAMAVGSQKIAIMNKSLIESFDVVRKLNPNGIIFANLSANEPYKNVVKALDMIEADGVQLHLNMPQEIIMEEGDRNYKGILNNISEVVNRINKPIIIKEVGYGISKETAIKLLKNGVKLIDIGGKGGTNFNSIEMQRSIYSYSKEFIDWGLSTEITLIETMSAIKEMNKSDIAVIASGGIWTGISSAKAFALGAKAIGIAGKILNILLNHGPKEVNEYIKILEKELKSIMLMLGIKNIEEFIKIPLVVTGHTKEWIDQRNIEIFK